MKKIAIIIISIFCSITSFGQSIDMNAFSSKVKVVDNQIPLSELREQQRGWIANLLWSNLLGIVPLPSSYEIKIMHTKEGILPFGVYAGFGSTQLFTNSDGYELEDGSEVWEAISFPHAIDEEIVSDLEKYNYFTIGLSKNINDSWTVYSGYSRVLGINRDEELYPFTTAFLII